MMPVLISTAMRSIVLATMTAGFLWLWRVRHPSVKKLAWALVMASSFAMPLMAGHLMSIPLRGQRTVRSGSVNQHAELAIGVPFARTEAAEKGSTADLVEKGTRIHSLQRWAEFSYLVGAGVLSFRLLLSICLAGRIWFRATRLPQLARVRLSAEVTSPFTFASGVILPASAQGWNEETMAVVLEHEFSHVRAGDFYLQAAAQLYRAIFWFSPLAWWLPKECRFLCEQTSDFAAMRRAAKPMAYAELLVRFSTQRADAAFVSMASRSGLSSRIDLILSKGEFGKLFSERRRGLASLAFALPIALLFATASIKAAQATRSSKDEALVVDERCVDRTQNVEYPLVMVDLTKPHVLNIAANMRSGSVQWEILDPSGVVHSRVRTNLTAESEMDDFKQLKGRWLIRVTTNHASGDYEIRAH